jgi:hypothetical protein
MRYANYPPSMLGEMRRSLWKGDCANADYWLGRIRGVTLAQGEAMAAHLVDQQSQAYLSPVVYSRTHSMLQQTFSEVVKSQASLDRFTLSLLQRHPDDLPIVQGQSNMVGISRLI